MKSRTLTRPMFRIGGSAGTGITSGLDQPRKELRQGTNPYDMGNFAPGTFPGFLTGFGLDLLSRPPARKHISNSGVICKRTIQRFSIS